MLTALGVPPESVRNTIQLVLGRNEANVAHQEVIPTSRVKKVIEIAFTETRRMASPNVGTQQ